MIGRFNIGPHPGINRGIVGQINKVEDDFVKLQVASNIELRVQKSAVGGTLPKGTLKSLDET